MLQKPPFGAICVSLLLPPEISHITPLSEKEQTEEIRYYLIPKKHTKLPYSTHHVDMIALEGHWCSPFPLLFGFFLSFLFSISDFSFLVFRLFGLNILKKKKREKRNYMGPLSLLGWQNVFSINTRGETQASTIPQVPAS